MRRANRTDANQAAIVSDARKAGIVFIPTTGDPKIGFDGLFAFKSQVVPAEIKDPAQKPSDRRLTKTEAARKAELEAVGAPYLIVETTEDVLRYFKLILDPLETRVVAMWRDGRTIDAVKLYRQERGGGLREALDSVRSLAGEPSV
jgi:hypothetical protein